MEEITKAEAEKMIFMFLGREVRIKEKEESRISYPARYMRKSELLKMQNNLKWTDITLEAAAEILSKTVFKSQFNFHYFNIKTAKWETHAFYVANVDTAIYSLKEGEEKCTSLSFQVTRIDPS